MTITTLSIGSRSATSYATVDEADDYLAFDPTFGEEWLDLDDNDKVRRLVAATRRLDLLTWRGKPVSSTQETAWPRTEVTNPDGSAFPNNAVPKDVEEVAIILAGDDSIDLKATVTDDSNVRSYSIGPKSEAFFHRTVSKNEILLPNGLLDRIAFWLGSDIDFMAAERFGGDAESEFTPDKYGKNIEGLF